MSDPTRSDYMQIVAEARRNDDCQRMLEAIPYMAFMGIHLQRSAGELLTSMRFSDHLIGNPTLPALHGGTLGALMESAAVFELMWRVELTTVPKIVNITVDYLRSGQPVDTYAKARLTRQGRRVATVSVNAWQDDRERPIASANLHLLISPA